MKKIGLGGGCHWCTEAVFQSLIGVHLVEQGWISSTNEHHSFSEAIIVHFDPATISLHTLVEIHLHTHHATSNHSMRKKYRSAIYVFDDDQEQNSVQILTDLQSQFKTPIITTVLPFVAFKGNESQFLDYYYTNPDKPFCQNYINPKLKLLLKRFSKVVNNQRMNHLIKSS